MHRQVNTMLELAHDFVSPQYALKIFSELPENIQTAMLSTWFTGRAIEMPAVPPAKIIGYRVTADDRLADRAGGLRKINAIKLARGLGRLGLKEAKDIIEGANNGRFNLDGESRNSHGADYTPEQIIDEFSQFGYIATPITE